MSHFCVMVITEQVPTQEVLDAVLLPYHEFECTGEVNQYVVDVEKIHDHHKEYEEIEKRFYQSPEGENIEKYDDRFFRDPTPEEQIELGPFAGTGWAKGVHFISKNWDDGRGYRVKIHFLPEGWKEVEIPVKDLMSFDDYAKNIGNFRTLGLDEQPDINDRDKWGYVRIDSEGHVISIIDRTNPNAKWDWWEVGGRYSNRLLLKSGIKADKARFDEIDWIGMRKEKADYAVRRWDEVRGAVGDAILTYIPWETVREDFPNEADRAREVYHNQLAVKRLNAAAEINRDLFFTDLGEYLLDREAHYQNAYNEGIATFAFLRDGVWYEKGNMGWWACVTNENEEWGEDFNDLLEQVPENHYVTIVDCHI